MEFWEKERESVGKRKDVVRNGREFSSVGKRKDLVRDGRGFSNTDESTKKQV